MRPERDNIPVPELPDGITWFGEGPESMSALTEVGPTLVHFLDFAQLNSVRTLPYLIEWNRRYRDAGLGLIGIQAPRFPFGFDPEVVATGLSILGVDFPVALDFEPTQPATEALTDGRGGLRWPAKALHLDRPCFPPRRDPPRGRLSVQLRGHQQPVSLRR